MCAFSGILFLALVLGALANLDNTQISATARLFNSDQSVYGVHFTSQANSQSSSRSRPLSPSK